MRHRHPTRRAILASGAAFAASAALQPTGPRYWNHRPDVTPFGTIGEYSHSPERHGSGLSPII